MIVYLDTSALVPLLVAEPTSPRCRTLWDGASTVLTGELTYVEAAAALARAERLGRVSPDASTRSAALLDDLWTDVVRLPVDRALVQHAAQLARRHGLRGYDAVHCATALRHRDSAVVAVCGDVALLAAWRAEGVAVADTNS